MAAKPVSGTEQVDRWLAAIDHPRKADVVFLRSLILGADPLITEHVKWNGPSFCHGGDDRVTMGLRLKGVLQLVFHRGAKVRPKDGFRFEDKSGLIRWAASDRGSVTWTPGDDVRARTDDLVDLVRRWTLATLD